MPHTIEFTRPETDSVSWVAPRFDCTLRDGGVDVAWVRVTGELDLVTAPILARALSHAEESARRVVLDLRELTFLDSSGVHVIFDADYRATAAGRRLVLVRGPADVDRVLALARPSDSLVIVDLDPGVPPVLALLMLAQRDRTDERLGRPAGGDLIVPIKQEGAADPSLRSQSDPHRPVGGVLLTLDAAVTLEIAH